MYFDKKHFPFGGIFNVYIQPYIRLHNRTGEETIFRQLLIHITEQYIILYSNRQGITVQS